MNEFLARLAVLAVIVVLFGTVIGLLARRKGFGFLNWFLSGTLILISALVLAFMASASDAGITPDEARRRRRVGNDAGQILSLIAFVLIVLSQVIGWMLQ